MTRFLDVPATARLIAQTGVTTFLSELVDTLRADYLQWADFDKSPRVACHSRNGVIELMPVANASLFAFKYVNGHPVNATRGMHTVMAFGALAEVDTGYPLLLAELTLTTALRTAATSVLAAQALARPDSHTMALIGNGAQSEFQAIAFHTLLGIDAIRVFDVDPHATDKLVQNLAAYPTLRVVRAASTADAVRGADIVTTVTADKAYATIVTADMIEPGMHLNAVGGDCPGKTELEAGVLQAGRVFVEFEPQSRIEGEIQQMPADFPVTELWRVLQGETTGRERADEVTVFDSVGFALEDYSALRYLYALAQQHNAGVEIALIPPAVDPKNLFALIDDPAAIAQGHVAYATEAVAALAR
ncbi:MAG: ornithine cyclodeaminase [Burkholderia contaminans]|uniref:Ornithine cyclodeaminase n=1 Tax=Burkholderia contaminans TaxID=488447 RepID=A0AAP4R111_9BURK|nr:MULTISPECIES: ornithine cyclodeaminase [Burkholderia]MBD1414628.1 ornithine cyclodeaminase [Burkholderia contaminans]MBH9667151.1 ornithine cyclodeaminase [Burkholderia contaminans]MBH9673300.1 ornithine cyclodeaminase [Burkholderia contaminans]MBH9703343.1 ornithine cyclodeaminase [Burkholderia contaminans]MBH9721304.1 ornithine cyclodeaminase [Burkholderia contaminans]